MKRRSTIAPPFSQDALRRESMALISQMTDTYRGSVIRPVSYARPSITRLPITPPEARPTSYDRPYPVATGGPRLSTIPTPPGTIIPGPPGSGSVVNSRMSVVPGSNPRMSTLNQMNPRLQSRTSSAIVASNRRSVTAVIANRRISTAKNGSVVFLNHAGSEKSS